MKLLPRSSFWEPKRNVNIKQTVKNCKPYQDTHQSPAKALVHSWEVIRTSCIHLHIDCDGLFQGQTFFTVANSFTKQLEVVRDWSCLAEGSNRLISGTIIQVLQKTVCDRCSSRQHHACHWCTVHF